MLMKRGLHWKMITANSAVTTVGLNTFIWQLKTMLTNLSPCFFTLSSVGCSDFGEYNYLSERRTLKPMLFWVWVFCLL